MSVTNGEDGATPLESLRQFQDYHWLMLKVFAETIDRHHGRDAVVQHIRAGAVRAGEFRGLAMHDDSAAIVGGRGVAQLLTNWHGGEWDLPALDGELVVTEGEGSLTLSLPSAPGLVYLGALLPMDLAVDALEAYWSGFAEGVSREYGLAMRVDSVSSVRWTVTFTGQNAVAPELGARLADERVLLDVNRRVTGLLGAIQMYITESLVDTYDASGEQTVREAAYTFGADRGSVIRERILAHGKQPTLANFASKDGLQERDPSEAVFVYRDRQHLSDGAYYIDCTYCPLAEVWKSEGERGLELAYLFDASNHRGLFQSYNPETEVRWHSVKSRGDTVCRFRFTVPSLLTEDDPTPEEWDAGDFTPVPQVG